MVAPIDFLVPALSCINMDMDWPDIELPGLPTLLLGGFGSMFAGLNLILPFIPIDPLELPDFTIPDLNIFLDGMFDFAIGLPSFPAITIDFPDISIPLPEFSGFELPAMPDFPWGGMPGFDPTALCMLIATLIALPFLIIQWILDSIFALELDIPDFDFIYDLLIDLGLHVGFSLPTMELFSGCFVTGIVSMINEVLGL